MKSTDCENSINKILGISFVSCPVHKNYTQNLHHKITHSEVCVLLFLIVVQSFNVTKDCLILLVDASKQMFTPSASGEVPFELCLKVRNSMFASYCSVLIMCAYSVHEV